MRRYLFLFLAVFILSACQVYKSEIPAEPLAVLPTSFSGDNHGGEGISRPFWFYFNDPALSRLEQEAMGNNPALAQAAARMEEAVARAGAAGATLFPWLNLKGRVGREHQLSSFASATGTSMNLSLAAGYEIDLWQRLAAGRAAADLGAAAAGLDLAAARISIAAQVADLYFLIIEQKAQLGLSNEMIASYSDSRDRVNRRYEAGLVPALDVYQARQNILAARGRKPGYEATYINSIHALAALVGRYPGDFSFTGAGLPSEPGKMFKAALPADLVAARPDIRAAWLRLLAADRDTAAAVAARFPTFNILAELGRGRLDFGRAVSDSFWSLALQGLAPVFDAGRRRAAVAAKKGAAGAALAGYRRVVLNAFREVEDSLTLIATTRRRLEILKQREKTAAETRNLAEDRYYQGLSDYLPVLSAQQQYFAIKGDWLAARRQMLSANISLARAVFLVGDKNRNRPRKK